MLPSKVRSRRRRAVVRAAGTLVVGLSMAAACGAGDAPNAPGDRGAQAPVTEKADAPGVRSDGHLTDHELAMKRMQKCKERPETCVQESAKGVKGVKAGNGARNGDRANGHSSDESAGKVQGKPPESSPQ